MVNVIRNIYLKYREFLLYGIIGGLSAGTDFGLFTLLTTQTALKYLWCNVIGVIAGITLSFLLNSFINFKKTDRFLQRFIMFYGVGLTGLLLSSIILYILVDFAGIYEIVSKLIASVVVVLFQYILNSRVTFAK